MNRALSIGLVWFLVIAAITGGVAAFRNELNGWFVGWLAIDAVSALLLIGSIRSAATEL
jgi:uncharacterized iron-regulated membrane protein